MGHHQALLSPSKANEHRVIERPLAREDLNVGILFRIIEIVEVYCCGNDLAFEEALVARLASFGEDRKPCTGLGQGPLQERVMAPAYDRGRFGGYNPIGPCHARQQPAIKVSPGKQPFAGALLHMPARILIFDFWKQSTANASGSRDIAYKCNLLVPSTCFCPPTRTSSRS